MVSHGLAVINVQASVALHLISERPGQAEVALAAIKTTNRDALDELRGILAEFRRAEGVGAPRRPPPGLDQLESLTADVDLAAYRCSAARSPC